MSRKFLPVNQVVDGVKGWTVLVQVVERSHVQLSRNARPTNYRRFVFTDSEGTKVSAVIYGNDVRYFSTLLMPFKRYYISNAWIRKVDPKYRVSIYEHSWVIHNRTLVEEYAEQIPPTLPCQFELQEFQRLHKFADTENLQNILCVVVHALPSREQGLDCTTRDFVVVNEEKRPMLLTLWNDFEANEGAQLASTITSGNIIIAMRVKVTTFNYLSMTTRLPSCLLLNPPTEQATTLKQWYNQNCHEIADMIEKVSYKDSTILLPPPADSEITPVEAALNTLKIVKTAWIRGNVTLATGQRSFWYTACMNCQKAVDASLEWVMRCPSCKEESGVEARCRIGIIINDGTSSINVVAFGKDAEKLIPFTGAELSQIDQQGMELFSTLASAIDNHELLCFVRHFDTEYQGQREDKYNIVKLYTSEEAAHITSTNRISQCAEMVPAITTNEKLVDVVPINEKLVAVLPVDISVSQTSQNVPAEKQFFSPTTKMVLTSIGTTTSDADKGNSSKCMPKKRLTFETMGATSASPTEQKSSGALLPNEGQNKGQNQPVEDDSTKGQKPTETSPLKKQRDANM